MTLQIADLLNYDSSKSDQSLVYILTLGVVENYRNKGIGMALPLRLHVLFIFKLIISDLICAIYSHITYS